MSASSCPHGDESFIVADYLAERLSGAEASAFEEHTFGCDRCFEELQRAAEVRAADTGEPAAAAARPRPGTTTWLPLALAATVLLAAGLWLAQPLFETPDPVYRNAGDGTGTANTLAVNIMRDGDRMTLSWAPVEGVDQYEIRVFSEAGDPVFERQSRGTSIELPVANWQESAPPGQFYVQVIALDELRQTIVQSDFEPL